ncbi:MlaD family protein [Nocardioides pantholopis]|uniref:MlaD family protein n=1 Tax=Nocardioides pantholopis TaxID=2483798 RepID=UPI000F09A12F|nr:MlaD family protein [Nocardioides pantholopis]
MITRRIRLQVLIFVLVALAAGTWLGVRYVGLDPFGSGYRVTAVLPESGGIFTNGEVTYRGVPVGRIEELRHTEDGVEAVLDIDGTAPDIPADVAIRVANRSVIGEQYVDLQPRDTPAAAGSTSAAATVRSDDDEVPLLADGDVLEGDAESLPPAVDQLLETGRDFVASVPQDALTTVIDETYDLSRGAGADLALLVETSQDFAETADSNFLVTAALIESSATVLETQQEAAGSIRGFSRDLDLIATTLRGSDGDLRRLIENAPTAAVELHRLFDQVGTPLGVLMGNLVSTAQVFGVNAAGVEDALVRAPEAISVGWSVTGSWGIDLGMAQTYFDPLPCPSGYAGTPVRPGSATGPGKPFNTKAGCTAPPSSGVNVRGPESVPKRSGAAARVRVADDLADLLGGS